MNTVAVLVMKNELTSIAYTQMITYPALNDQQLADKIGLTRSTVWRLRQKLVGKIDFELAQRIAGQFLVDYQMASDYFKLQVTNLEEQKTGLEKLKDGTKTIFKKDSDGKSYAEEVQLNSFDKLTIDRDIRELMKQQQTLWKDIMFLARQGQGAEVMKMISSGRIQLPNQ